MALTFFSWIDYTVFSLMTALGCVIGVYFGFYKKQVTVQNYLYGNRNLQWFPVSMSVVSSLLSGLTLLSFPTEVYMYGTQISILLLSVFTCGWINYFVFLPVFFKLQLSSIYEYLELRYNNYVRNTFSLMYIIKTIFLLPVVMYVPSLIFSQVSGVNLHIIAPIMILTCIFYTAVGGIKAVIWADTLQLAVTVFALTFVIIMSLISIGGFDVVFNRLQAGDRWEFFNFDLDPTVRTTFWTVFIGQTFSWTGTVSVAAAEVQRFLALSSMNSIKKSLITFTVFIIVVQLCCFLLGAIIYAKYYDCDPKSIGEIQKFDQIVPYFITEVTQGFQGLNGLFVATYFGAAFSTYSTALNTVASVLYVDFVDVYVSNELFRKNQTVILKLITFIIGTSSIGIIYLVEHLGTVFEIVHYLKSITGGATLGIFLLGLIVPFANVKGAITGTVSSVIFMAVIVIRAQVYIWNGDMKQHTKPLYSYGCNTTNDLSRFTTIDPSLTTPLPTVYKQEEAFWLFRISFQYYLFLGTVITLFIGVVVSWITRKKTDKKVNPECISPFIHRISIKLQKKKIEYPVEAEPLHIINN